MDRKAKRKQERKQNKPKYSLLDVQRAMNVAIEMKKHTKGHLFKKHLKDLCIFCGASDKTRKQCPYWFFTFLDRMQVVLINPAFFTDNEVQALWLRNEDDYKDVQIPLNMHIR